MTINQAIDRFGPKVMCSVLRDGGSADFQHWKKQERPEASFSRSDVRRALLDCGLLEQEDRTKKSLDGHVSFNGGGLGRTKAGNEFLEKRSR